MHVRALALLALLALSLAPAARASIEAADRIRAVTVHPDRAEVTRRAEVRVPAGESRIVFGRIPKGAEPESFTVRGRGVRATLGALELRTEETAQSTGASPEAAELRAVDAALGRLGVEEATDASVRAYLDHVRDTAARDAASPRLDVAGMQSVLALLRTGYGDLDERRLKRDAARSDLVARQAAARARQQEAGRAQGDTPRLAIVDVSAAEAGTLSLDLVYVVSGATWRPTYRATLDADKAVVDLASEATVMQATDEDWSGVELTLSTAQPSVSLEPPDLHPWQVAPQPPAVASRDAGASGASSVDGGLRAQVPSLAIRSFDLLTSGASARYGEHSTGVREIASAITEAGYHLSFSVPGTSDIASDGAEHRVTLRRDTLKAAIEHRGAPAIEQHAFAVAVCKAPADRPLLGGPVRVTAGGAYLGSTDIDLTPPGGDITIPFGADARVELTHVELPRERGREGQVAAGSRSTVQNFHDAPVTVKVEERIPVADDPRIVVKLGDGTTDGGVQDEARPGIVTWTLTLEPMEKRELALEYVVRHPKDMLLAGL